MARRKNTKRIDPRYFLNETTHRDEIESAINEVELAPAMYNALKAKGQLPPGAKMKGAQQAQPQAAQGGGNEFDTESGKPLTKSAEQKCAAKADCYNRHIKPMLKMKFSTQTGQPTETLKQIAAKNNVGGGLKIPDNLGQAEPSKGSRLKIDPSLYPDEPKKQAQPQQQAKPQAQPQTKPQAGAADREKKQMALMQQMTKLQQAQGNTADDAAAMKIQKKIMAVAQQLQALEGD